MRVSCLPTRDYKREYARNIFHGPTYSIHYELFNFYIRTRFFALLIDALASANSKPPPLLSDEY